MNERILGVLEFGKIIEKLTGYAETSLGKDAAQRLKPSTELPEVVKLQNETDEAQQVLRLKGHIPFGGIRNIKPHLKRTSIGGVLSATECVDVATTIYGGKELKRFVEEMEEPDMPILRELVDIIHPLPILERTIRNSIDDNGVVMDGASDTLRSIRSRINTLESRLRDKMESYTKQQSEKLSDAIVTIRNERYVLPVKQEYRGSIKGIVHDQSSSGATLFIEPQPVVDINNDLQEARVQEKREVDRILGELSEAIEEDRPILAENVRVLAGLDFIFARAKLGRSMGAAMPAMNNEGRILMKQARHPLISEEEVVPNDIELGTDFTSIIITGPNTGGKTVTLKLVGLCTLMAQAGLQIPAMDGCELAVFDNVYADIGDEQSIEQSLSTFSSHMTNIVDILDKVDDSTLVLFDELGAGTDPQEGAALAMAILDEVVDKDARVIATTHYPELKAYGYNRENVVNASVEFNIETLEPTYRLLIGVPGRSNAFEISRRLGLREDVISAAKERVGVDSESVESMIASLDEARREAEADYERAEEIRREAEEIYSELNSEWKRFEDQKEKLYKKAEEKAKQSVDKAREEAQGIVDELKQMKNSSELKEHEWIEARKMFDEAEPELTKKEKQPKNKQSNETKELQAGDEVKLLTLNQQGVIVEKGRNDEYQVQVGSMKVKAKRKDLEFVKTKKPEREKQIAPVRGKTSHVKPELDLRGERYEDALNRLEKYLDDALLAGYPQVSIIHGKGTGALRQGVQSLAKRHSRISTARSGGMKEGGSGVTVLELK
ncbi:MULTISPECIES: endonuclease MutS2 [Salimicrobium]|uniref:Endonuclease MutS2 n=3 Tax=Salimicrobium TaxID=351195 RepID=K2GAQ9_9BACI|nr:MULTISPECIES: endonuclease MutS2 [Salimicrobium]AKG04169.1 endonuclease MutS2 [Salimicrobium jeotgali]EKE32133.1 DNA mismatch repair protein MutS [Salimicrobium jeotgali]MBM7695744.1 DNA mismatch repair protein MutS2 [Salimicrobium jeotgali]SDX60586.1 DNA mismatch repair protein MutS2 [Salimicrobium album]SIS50108.1 DNA mismatch repair protein MutS2 [Salimicrobium salexigens]